MLDEKAEDVFDAAEAFLERPPRDLESSGVRQKNSSSDDSFLFLLFPEADEDFLEIDVSPWEELEPSKREKKKLGSYIRRRLLRWRQIIQSFSWLRFP